MPRPTSVYAEIAPGCLLDAAVRFARAGYPDAFVLAVAAAVVYALDAAGFPFAQDALAAFAWGRTADADERDDRMFTDDELAELERIRQLCEP